MKKIHSNFQIVPLKTLRDFLAAERTDLALETTQLAWIRTVLTIMIIGIAISKGSDMLLTKKVVDHQAVISNANITGIALTISGTVMLTVITFYFIVRRRQLARTRGIYSFGLIPVLLISIFIILAGVGLSYLLIVS